MILELKKFEIKINFKILLYCKFFIDNIYFNSEKIHKNLKFFFEKLRFSFYNEKNASKILKINNFQLIFSKNFTSIHSNTLKFTLPYYFYDLIYFFNQIQENIKKNSFFNEKIRKQKIKVQ